MEYPPYGSEHPAHGSRSVKNATAARKLIAVSSLYA
jgi:hypothetical protein